MLDFFLPCVPNLNPTVLISAPRHQPKELVSLADVGIVGVFGLLVLTSATGVPKSTRTEGHAVVHALPPHEVIRAAVTTYTTIPLRHNE